MNVRYNYLASRLQSITDPAISLSSYSSYILCCVLTLEALRHTCLLLVQNPALYAQPGCTSNYWHSARVHSSAQTSVTQASSSQKLTPSSRHVHARSDVRTYGQPDSVCPGLSRECARLLGRLRVSQDEWRA